MKTSIASLTFILTTVLYGITPAIAEPFNDRGPAIVDSVVSSSATPSTARDDQSPVRLAQIPSGFNDAFNYETPGLSTRSAAGALLGRHCDTQSPVGFNDVSPTATC